MSEALLALGITLALLLAAFRGRTNGAALDFEAGWRTALYQVTLESAGEQAGQDVHAVWRDTMLRQKREVPSNRLRWNKLDRRDQQLDQQIAQAVIRRAIRRVEEVHRHGRRSAA